jgi:integrase
LLPLTNIYYQKSTTCKKFPYFWGEQNIRTMPKVKGEPQVKFNLTTTKAPIAYIILFYHYRGHQVRTATGQKCNPAFWDAERQRVKLDKRHPENSATNNALDDIAAVVRGIYKDSNLGADITPEDFKKEIGYRMKWEPRPTPEKAAFPSLFDFIENTLLPEKRANPRGTWKVLQTGFNLLSQYAQERRAGRLEYSDIDYSFFADFKAWLFAAPRQHSINYAGKVVDVLKQFMRDAQRRGYHSKTDYQNFSIKKVKTTKFALTFEELEALYWLDLSNAPRLEKVRDLFLIGAYTGLRFSDFTRIRPEHIDRENGHEILTLTTQKTGEVVSIPLMPIPAALLKKYNFRTPSISNQKMNSYLKELAQVAGMDDKMIVTTTQGGKRREDSAAKWEMLTTHVARRSFATNFYRAGFPAAKLMKVTGHATERQFMQYIAIDVKMNALDLAEGMREKTLRLIG